jgi:hypothetical protein
MPIHTITFNLPEENDELNLAIKASAMSVALFDIGQEVFRPARKHGYNNQELNDLIEKNPDASEIISILEKMFYNILTDNNIGDLT